MNQLYLGIDIGSTTVKAVVVDPRLSATASKSDEWLPVKPGEDGALAVAMAHVILTEGLWYKSVIQGKL